jgi:hypothetical protein
MNSAGFTQGDVDEGRLIPLVDIVLVARSSPG